MARTSAGLLMYRVKEGGLQVSLVHPGGPFFRNKDAGAWSIPKGEPNADGLSAGDRPAGIRGGDQPETGRALPAAAPHYPEGRQDRSCRAFAGDCDPAAIKSNTFEMEWPPKSGRLTAFPEIDRAEFFDLPAARKKIKAGQEAAGRAGDDARKQAPPRGIMARQLGVHAHARVGMASNPTIRTPQTAESLSCFFDTHLARSYCWPVGNRCF